MSDERANERVNQLKYGSGRPLRIKSDLLKVRHVPFDLKGDKVEPEAQPAARVISTDSEVTMNMRGNSVGAIPTQIIAETTAGEVAETMRAKCFLCKRFDSKAWNQIRKLWGNSADKDTFEKLNKIRYALLTMRNNEALSPSIDRGGDLDVEHALAQLGICQPLTELNRDLVIVSPLSTCPDNVCTKDNPKGLFVPKDKEHERLGNTAFDKIMRMAEGKAS